MIWNFMKKIQKKLFLSAQLKEDTYEIHEFTYGKEQAFRFLSKDSTEQLLEAFENRKNRAF